MDPLQTTASLIDHPTATAFSALPDAPVIPPRERRHRAAAARAHLAEVLHHLADAVAPAPTATPATPAPSPRRAWAGSR